MDTQQYLGLFVSESREHLANLNTSLLELEKNPQNRPALDELFRAVHTIKGMSATMGFDTLTTISHKIEDVLDGLKNAKNSRDAGDARDARDVTTKTIDTLFRCFDTIEELVDLVEKGKNDDLDVSDVIDELDRLKTKGVKVAKGTRGPGGPRGAPLKKTQRAGDFELTQGELKKIRDLVFKGFRPYLISIDLYKECALKSVRAFIVFKNLDRRGHILKSNPGFELIEDERFDLNFSVLMLSKDSGKDIEKTVKSIPEIENVKVTKFKLEEAGAAKKANSVKSVKNAGSIEKAPEKRDKDAPQRSVQSVRVNIEHLDSLMNLMGELIINKTRLKQIAIDNRQDDLDEALAVTERLITELQEEILQIRMVPIEHVFNRFPRIVRDISREEGKLIDFIIEGGEIELDRTVLDEIADPLVHLIRNSVDHGIETPKEREKKKKPRRGKLTLEAIREKEQISIVIEDDGRGIDTRKIKEVAVAKGLISGEDARTLTEREEVNLIFLPGFSTAAKVTNISGRGIGLDVVKTGLESLGGAVELETELGKGTRITLKLPLTLAIVPALLIRSDDEIYAIPTTNVVRIVDTNPGDVKTIQNRKVITVQGEVIPIIKLDEYFNVCKKTGGRDIPDPRDSRDTQDTRHTRHTAPIVIVSNGIKKAGIGVDELVGQQEIVIKSLGDPLRRIKGFAGGTILGDGRVALILDVGGMI